MALNETTNETRTVCVVRLYGQTFVLPNEDEADDFALAWLRKHKPELFKSLTSGRDWDSYDGRRDDPEEKKVWYRYWQVKTYLDENGEISFADHDVKSAAELVKTLKLA